MSVWDYGMTDVADWDSIIANLSVLVVENKITIGDAAHHPLASGLLSKKLNKRKENAMKVSHFEDRLDPHIFTIGADAAYNAANLHIKDGASHFVEGTVIFIPETFEMMTCAHAPNADLSTNDAYNRGAGSQAKALTAGMTVVCMGRLSDELEGAPTSRMTTKQERIFYPSAMDDYVVQTTLFENVQRQRHGSERLYQQRKKQMKYMLDLEHNFWFSRGGANVGEAEHVRPAMTGILDYIIDYGGVHTKMDTFTYGDLNSHLAQQAKFHKGEYAMFTGNRVSQIIDSWGRDYLHVDQSEKFFGMQLDYILTTFGKVYLFKEPWWTDGDLSGYAFILPLPVNEFIEVWTPMPIKNPRFLTGEGTWYFDIEKNNNVKYTKDEFFAMKALELWSAEKFGFIYGIKG